MPVKLRRLHPWRVSTADALALQRALRPRLRLDRPARQIHTVAAADVAYCRRTHRMYAAVVVVDLAGFRVLEEAHATQFARFPYVPGLFAFRELPPLLAAFRRLRVTPDVILFDGHGLAHPRRFGLACHAGLLLGLPAVGCAKSKLVGRYDPPGPDRGDWSPLTDGPEVIGAVLRSRASVQPVYVSAGHLIDLPSSIELVLRATGRFRIPEPLRLAHRATGDLLRRLAPRQSAPARRTYPNFIRRAQ